MATQLKEARLLGYPVHLVDKTQAETFVQEALSRQKTVQVVTLNPEMMMQGDENPVLSQILKAADVILPDGAGLVWALRKQGHSVSRLPGIEFSESLLKWAAETNQPVALVGAAESVLALAVENLQTRFPGLRIVYQHHGFFKPDEEEAKIVQACADALPKIVLVALGVPRQEIWIHRHKALFPGAVMVGVGGSLDVWSGKTLRAPAWMRRLNLEWLYRISSEPWRIKRIYKTLPMFVVKVWLAGFDR
ncbi:WecB/TagA/CpsF family glycosyltransferase [Vampirovibrio sp.]|uniref:WecB/TagA/CpsF family glycosyltransferase n=1 Tax=Vampirovibrio sp. TaxID=2717857 RepID=UPI003594242F